MRRKSDSSQALMSRKTRIGMLVCLLLTPVVGFDWLQPSCARADDFDKAPIFYSNTKGNNAITQLQKQLDSGKAKLKYDDNSGFLRSLLDHLKVPESSQMLVFSKTSMQRGWIRPSSPRAIFFNDDVYIGYCKDAPVLEVSAVDPQLGAVFYTLEQHSEQPRFTRQDDRCLLCHGSSQTHGVPGHLVRSVFPDPEGFPVLSSGTFRINHSSPLEQRWGGWYVTGTHGDQTHLGNLIITTRQVPRPVKNPDGLNLTSLDKRVNLSRYPTKHSDIVALMVLEHQTDGHNLITNAAFQTRIALHMEQALNKELKEDPNRRWKSTTIRIESAGNELVRYLLFSKEAKLTAKIKGTTTYAEDFMKQGPRDTQGRSLRDLDLEKRLFKYPCSYLIYSPSFDALPDPVKDYVYERLWDILNGMDYSGDFDHLTQQDRQAVLEILLATKPDLPAYWKKKS